MKIYLNTPSGFPKTVSDTPAEIKLLQAIGNYVAARKDLAHTRLNSPRAADGIANLTKSVNLKLELAATQIRKFVPGPATFDGFRTNFHGTRAVSYRGVWWVLVEADPVHGTPLMLVPLLDAATKSVLLDGFKASPVEDFAEAVTGDEATGETTRASAQADPVDVVTIVSFDGPTQGKA